jgi:hypothetical protein
MPAPPPVPEPGPDQQAPAAVLRSTCSPCVCGRTARLTAQFQQGGACHHDQVIINLNPNQARAAQGGHRDRVHVDRVGLRCASPPQTIRPGDPVQLWDRITRRPALNGP